MLCPPLRILPFPPCLALLSCLLPLLLQSWVEHKTSRMLSKCPLLSCSDPSTQARVFLSQDALEQQQLWEGETDDNGILHLHVSVFSCGSLISYRRFLNKSSEDDMTSERPPPSEGTSSDPVTLRRRMLAAAAERRLQRQQTT